MDTLSNDNPASAITCVTPLSSPYSLLPRVHTYAVVFALLLPLPRGWLFRAALATLTTRTAIYAVDAAVLLAFLQRGQSRLHGLPVDVLITTELLGLAALAGIWLLVVSSTAGSSSARGLLRLWTGAVAVGAILSFAALRELPSYVGPDHCDKSEMETATLFGAPKTIRVFGTVGEVYATFLLRVGLPAPIFAGFALLAAVFPRPVKKEIRHSDSRGKTLQDITSVEIQVDDDKPFTRVKGLWPWVRGVLAFVIPVLAALLIAATEYFLHVTVPDIPEVEDLHSVGQWGVWAATGVVLVATLLNAAREKNEGSRRDRVSQF